MWTNSLEYQRKHYKEYYWTKKAIAKRVKRNRARLDAIKSWKVKKYDKSKQVDHKNGNAMDNSRWNLRVISSKLNGKLWAKKANKSKWKGYKKRKTLKKSLYM